VKIGIYVDVAKDKEPRGVGFHVLHLVRALSKVDSSNEYLLYYRRDMWDRTDQFPHCPQAANFSNRPVSFPKNWEGNHPRLWWNHYLPWAIVRDRLDVFHGPNHFLPNVTRAKTIVTIHDLAFFKMELYRDGITAAMRHWTRSALDHADRVIAISQNTRRDIEELGVNPERIRLIYGGGNIQAEGDIQYDRSDELRRLFNLPEKYILFVGTIHPRKNVPFLLRSFAKLRAQGLAHKLVLAGRPDAAAGEVTALIDELGIAAEVIITGYVEEWQIPLLYKMSDVFVLPTLYEGFTLVTLEAMAYGVPVISTDTSSIREGVGDAGLLVPVNDVDALTTALRRVLTEPGLAERMIADGKMQAEKFSWERCARETLTLYQELNDGGYERVNRAREELATVA
jgi:glycosyltransferase involved in cell wall biosynthesis